LYGLAYKGKRAARVSDSFRTRRDEEKPQVCPHKAEQSVAIMLEYQVKRADEGARLDILVANLYPEFTRSSMESLFDKGLVAINNSLAKPSYKVRSGDTVMIDETYLKQQPESIELPIIYEDKDVIVINKPAGILTHSKGAVNLEPTVASFIKDRITDKDMTGNRAGIVHRLDRGTSGVIVTAKNSSSQYWLQKQFSQRKVNKIYRAVVEGLPDPTQAMIDAPIGRNPKRPQTFKVVSGGKSAQTIYKVIKEFKKNGKNYSELELAPKTGRTHQLRVHLAYIGHPIVGDNLYGHDGRPILLHAQSLELNLPNKQRRIFGAPLPKRFKAFTDD
jgi:23S rRNA pseudouridine1911/1915/1917 synthase